MPRITRYLAPLLSLTLLLLFTSFMPSSAERKDFHVIFRQYGKEIPVQVTKSGNILNLKKDVFEIELVLPTQEGILINACTDTVTYSKAKAGAVYKELPGFWGVGMAEEPRNKDEDIRLSYENSMYWYYESDKVHRFSRVEKKKNGLHGTRIIRNFSENDVEGRPTRPLSQLKGNDLYLVFIDADQDLSTYEFEEFQREYVQIHWEEKKP